MEKLVLSSKLFSYEQLLEWDKNDLAEFILNFTMTMHAEDSEIEVNEEDISSRNLDKNTKGAVVTKIENKSPLLNVLSINDIIIEVQKTPVKKSSDLKNIVDNIFKKGEKTLLLTIINKNNRRRYLGVKIN